MVVGPDGQVVHVGGSIMSKEDSEGYRDAGKCLQERRKTRME